MELFTVILSTLLIVCFVGIFNLMRQVEKLEDTVEKYQDHLSRLSNVIQESDKYLQELDQSGIFQADDEVGVFFENMRNVQETISRFKI